MNSYDYKYVNVFLELDSIAEMKESNESKTSDLEKSQWLPTVSDVTR